MRYVPHDAETFSTLDLTEVGSAIYAADPTTDANCVSFCIVTDDVCGPTLTWLPGGPIPPEILEAAADPETLFVAHNDAFERAITTHILHPRYGWPLIPIERRRCTMASALSHVLPAILDKVTAALQQPRALPRQSRTTRTEVPLIWKIGAWMAGRPPKGMSETPIQGRYSIRRSIASRRKPRYCVGWSFFLINWLCDKGLASCHLGMLSEVALPRGLWR